MTLEQGDALRERLDHAAVLNAYKTQGKSIDRVIAVMDTGSRMLASPFNAYVMMTRQISELSLYTDDKGKLVRQIGDHEGGAAHGLDVAESGKGQDAPELDVGKELSLQLTPDENARVERETGLLVRSITGMASMIKQSIDKIGVKPEPVRMPEPEPERDEPERGRDRSRDDWGIGD
jgi:hypothetical protein